MKVRQASWNALHNISFSLSSHLFLFTAKSTSKLSILSLRLFSSAQVCAAWVDCHAIILVASVRWDVRVIRRVARQHLRLKLVFSQHSPNSVNRAFTTVDCLPFVVESRFFRTHKLHRHFASHEASESSFLQFQQASLSVVFVALATGRWTFRIWLNYGDGLP